MSVVSEFRGKGGNAMVVQRNHPCQLCGTNPMVLCILYS